MAQTGFAVEVILDGLAFINPYWIIHAYLPVVRIKVYLTCSEQKITESSLIFEAKRRL